MSEVAIGPYDVKNIEEVIAAAKLKVGRIKNITDYDAELEYHINDAARWMCTLETTLKCSKPIDVLEGRAKLPCGMHDLLAVKPLYDQSITPNPDTNYFLNCRDSEMWYTEKNFIELCGSTATDPIQARGNSYEIVGGFIHFNYPYPTNLTKVLVAYKAMATDDNGFMIIHADYEKPLSAYAAWKLLSTYPEIYPKEYLNVYYVTLKNLETEYKQYRAAIQSASQHRHFENNKVTIRNLFNGLFTYKRRG